MEAQDPEEEFEQEPVEEEPPRNSSPLLPRRMLHCRTPNQSRGPSFDSLTAATRRMFPPRC